MFLEKACDSLEFKILFVFIPKTFVAIKCYKVSERIGDITFYPCATLPCPLLPRSVDSEEEMLSSNLSARENRIVFVLGGEKGERL